MSRAEKFIIDSINNYSNEKRIPAGKVGYWIKQPYLTPGQARKAVEIARKETIKEVYEWMDNNKEEYQYKAPYNYFDMEQCIEDLKKHMESLEP